VSHPAKCRFHTLPLDSCGSLSRSSVPYNIYYGTVKGIVNRWRCLWYDMPKNETWSSDSQEERCLNRSCLDHAEPME
jgi:hypothetical protein